MVPPTKVLAETYYGFNYKVQMESFKDNIGIVWPGIGEMKP